MKSLPLAYKTPPRWADIVLEDTLALLSDHAYLERKAASNALELLNRWPEPMFPKTWIPTLTGVARDEALHLDQVTRHLAKRGGRLARLHKNPYANALRNLVRMGDGPREILDRLLVSAIIEARSCERFKLLAAACDDKELSRFYDRLCHSEWGHHTVFLKLGREIQPRIEVDERWKELLKEEAQIISAQPLGPTMHSGVSPN